MTILEIFEKVSLVTPLEQRRFFNYLNDSVNELFTMYNKFVLKDGKEYVPFTSLNDENTILPLYYDAIANNILFLSGQDPSYKGEFLRKADEAYKRYWTEDAKGRRLKRARW